MENKVCLVIIFNNRFDKNLPLLRKIYGERFSNIRFLMPFYDGSDPDVIPVYERTYCFQGYLIQAYEKLKDIPCSHYLFIADDLIINPQFDETNFVDSANMHDKKFLSRTPAILNSPNRFRWWWTINSSKPFYDPHSRGKEFLCPYDEALSKFNDFFGVKYKEVYEEDFFGNPNVPGRTMSYWWSNADEFYFVVNEFKKSNGNSFKIPYPMACGGGNGDIFCIQKDSLLEFSRLCGIFSAMDMFEEIAIPTATVLIFKRDEVVFFSPESGLMVCTSNDKIALENKYDRDFNRLYSEWDPKIFYVHPVKLSRWKV